MDLGPLGPVGNMDTGSDVQAWAHVSGWTVTRWEQVLRYRPDLAPMNTDGDVNLPGVGAPVKPFQLAALVHRVVTDPDAGRWRGWTILFGWLDSVTRRQSRIGWKIKAKVIGEVTQILNQREAMFRVLSIQETYDPFVPLPMLSPPVPNAPHPKNIPAPPA